MSTAFSCAYVFCVVCGRGKMCFDCVTGTKYSVAEMYPQQPFVPNEVAFKP